MLGVKTALIFLTCQMFAATFSEPYVNRFLELNFPRDVIEDAGLDTEELLIKYKYPVETHYVTTEDGYILRMHRIANPKRSPVLLLHGLLDSSATWIMMGPKKSLGYILYDTGFDVWMGNVRGNRYSRNHTTLNPMKTEFWTFSWHEIGFYDLPAMINYILKVTKFERLSYVGHSQGTTSFFVFGSMHPNHLKKVSSMHALAPVAFMKNVKNPFLGLMKNFVKLSGDLITEFMPHSTLLLRNCFANRITLRACTESFFLMMGKNDKQLNETYMPVVFGHAPAGCNLKQFRHYLQLTEQDRFGQFDYGPAGNQKVYGQPTPPDYNVSNINIPVAMFYGFNDNLSSDEDVQRLFMLLSDVKMYPFRQGNHVTMIWGKCAIEEVFKPIVDFMKAKEMSFPILPETRVGLFKNTAMDLTAALLKKLYIL